MRINRFKKLVQKFKVVQKIEIRLRKSRLVNCKIKENCPLVEPGPAGKDALRGGVSKGP